MPIVRWLRLPCLLIELLWVLLCLVAMAPLCLAQLAVIGGWDGTHMTEGRDPSFVLWTLWNLVTTGVLAVVVVVLVSRLRNVRGPWPRWLHGVVLLGTRLGLVGCALPLVGWTAARLLGHASRPDGFLKTALITAVVCAMQLPYAYERLRQGRPTADPGTDVRAGSVGDPPDATEPAPGEPGHDRTDGSAPPA